jgi:hypothetical protein
VFAEHSLVKQNIRLVGDSVNDVEALFGLERTYSGLTQTSLEELPHRQERLELALSLLREGLANHFAFEENALPPLFGEVLMDALVLEHHTIRKAIDKAQDIVHDSLVDRLDQEGKLAWKSVLQKVINGLTQEIHSHAADEETVLKMLKKSLQSGKESILTSE